MTDLAFPVVIVTTAAIPWMTGTSISPLFRASTLQDLGYKVRIYLPWVDAETQQTLFAEGLAFADQAEQREFIQQWMVDNGLNTHVEINFYPAKYDKLFLSIYPAKPLPQLIVPASILLLEEPEHLFFKHGLHTKALQADHVWAVLHTNYAFCYRAFFSRPFKFLAEPLNLYESYLKSRFPNLIRLSAALPAHKQTITENVHGVLPRFFDVEPPQATSDKLFYFIGKYEFYKGFRELATLWQDLDQELKSQTIDCFGGGTSKEEIMGFCAERGLQLNAQPATTNPSEALAPYRAFVNCSRSEGLCTTSMESLAMGKWLVIPRHPSNEFFYDFENCLPYSSSDEFAQAIARCVHELPQPLSVSERKRLSWQGATERLLQHINNQIDSDEIKGKSVLGSAKPLASEA